jgi:lysophospholipase L1-like esterase
VQGKTAEQFKTNLRAILDHVQAQLKNPSKLILITIPDFSVVPAAAYFGNAQTISNGIAGFNQIILAEGKQRKIAVVDIFALSQKMKGDASLQAADGLHPSAKEYAQWEKLIFPAAELLLALGILRDVRCNW